MTVGEIMDFETKLGRRATQQEISDEETKRTKAIKAYANHTGYSDVNPFEVIKVVSPICVEIRALNTKQIRYPANVQVGGFSAHVVDNREGQKYEYSQNPDAPTTRIRWSKAKRQWQSASGNRYRMSNKPHKFYDYNF